MAKILGWVWLFAFVLLAVYFFSAMDSLPDRLAVHFDMNGNPNGFQSKAEFISFFSLFMFGIEGLLAAVCFGIEKIPIRWINIPWKAYWLSRPEKSALMFKKMRLIMTLTGLFVTLVFFFTVHTVVQANTKNVWLNIPINAGAVGILGLSILLVVAAFAITWPPKD